MRRGSLVGVLLLSAAIYLAGAHPNATGVQDAATVNHLSDPFASGWMLVVTSGDGVVDAISGKIVVPDSPTAAENAAAANMAARVAYGSTGLTLPLVVTAARSAGTGQPAIWIGKALPGSAAAELGSLAHLEAGEGGVFLVAGNLAIVGADDVGLSAAAEAYSARAPFQWNVHGRQAGRHPRCGRYRRQRQRSGARRLGIPPRRSERSPGAGAEPASPSRRRL